MFLCPNCGAKQETDDDCRVCGTNIARWLAAQQARLDKRRTKKKRTARLALIAGGAAVALVAIVLILNQAQEREVQQWKGGEAPATETTPAPTEAPAANPAIAPTNAAPANNAAAPTEKADRGAPAANVPGRAVAGCVVPPAREPESEPPPDAPNGPETRARAWTELLASAKSDPVGRWAGCLKRFAAVGRANPGRPLVECVDTIELCGDARGAPGCCPAACLEQFKQACVGGECAEPAIERKMLEKSVLTGNCLPGHEQPL